MSLIPFRRFRQMLSEINVSLIPAFNYKGKIYKGASGKMHSSVYYRNSELPKERLMSWEDKGYMDEKGNYMNRKAAFKYAHKNFF